MQVSLCEVNPEKDNIRKYEKTAIYRLRCACLLGHWSTFNKGLRATDIFSQVVSTKLQIFEGRLPVAFAAHEWNKGKEWHSCFIFSEGLSYPSFRYNYFYFLLQWEKHKERQTRKERNGVDCIDWLHRRYLANPSRLNERENCLWILNEWQTKYL